MKAPAAEALAIGVADRLRTLLLALDRRDRLESAPSELVGWLPRETAAGRLPEHARELLLRALRVGADPLNFALLRLLEPVSPRATAELMRLTGLDRVALSERVNDLAQTGLAVREMIGDQVRGTPLAAALVALVDEAAAAAGEQLTRELAGQPAGEADGASAAPGEGPGG